MMGSELNRNQADYFEKTVDQSKVAIIQSFHELFNYHYYYYLCVKLF